MRIAVVVAPPHAGGSTLEVLTRNGFEVVAVTTSSALRREFDLALLGVSVGDHILVVLSGRFAMAGDRAALLVSEDTPESLPIHLFGEAVLMRAPQSVMFVVEARHED